MRRVEPQWGVHIFFKFCKFTENRGKNRTNIIFHQRDKKINTFLTGKTKIRGRGANAWRIISVTIHLIFSLASDWLKRFTLPNITPLRKYSQIFKTAHVPKKNWRIINTIRQYPSSGAIICSNISPKMEPRSDSEDCSLPGTDNVRGQIAEHTFPPNGGCCLVTIKLHKSGLKKKCKYMLNFGARAY